MELYQFFIVVIVSVGITTKIIYDTQGVCFASGDRGTDNEKMLWAATEISLFNWPSRMHDIPYNRGQLREFYVIALRLLGKIFKNKKSDHLNITLALVSNCLTTILLYFVIGNYFNFQVGFIIALLYAGCIWPYQIIFVIGHIHLAQMFFMFAVVALQLSEILVYSELLLFLGGVFTAVSFFSSSSSRKYPPMAAIALFFSLRAYLQIPTYSQLRAESEFFVLCIVAAFLIWGVGRILAPFITPIFSSITKKNWKVHHIYWMTNKTVWAVLVSGFFKWLFVSDDLVFYFLAFYVLGGLCITAFILMPPSTLAANIIRYHSWLNLSSWASHFKAYPDPVKTFGKQLPENFRGEGMPWVPKFFWRVIPLIVVLYLCSACVVGYHFVFESVDRTYGFLMFGFLFLTSLAPIIISEATKSLQVGKSYIPSLIALLMLIGKAIEIVELKLQSNQDLHFIFIAGLLSVVVLQMGISTYHYFSDILPARMAPTMLRDKLHELGISCFYTYDNSYNNAFVNAMLYSYPNEFQVKRIDKLDDVKDGYIVVPNTSSKSEHMESDSFSANYGDFTDDETLNQLYATKSIEKAQVGKFRTRGCSPFFSLEAEVTGYRDLILKQVKEYDRWIAHGWILSAEKVQSFIANGKL